MGAVATWPSTSAAKAKLSEAVRACMPVSLHANLHTHVTGIFTFRFRGAARSWTTGACTRICRDSAAYAPSALMMLIVTLSGTLACRVTQQASQWRGGNQYNQLICCLRASLISFLGSGQGIPSAAAHQTCESPVSNQACYAMKR